MAVKNVISLKALVDKGSNTIIFVESDNDFIDVLLSFFTIPMGTIVRRARKHSVPLEIGCMSNLFASVANIDVRHFQTEACKEMLLCPHNGAESHCKNLKLKIDNDEPTGCMNQKFTLSVSSSAEQGGGIFVKESARFVITDDLHVMSPLSVASNPVFTKLGAMNENSTTEQQNLNIGAHEVLNLLLRSLVSKKPLSETILKHNPVPNPNLSLLNLDQLILTRIESLLLGDTMNEEEEEEKIVVKLTISVLKNIVCYAEAGEDFVNLLFSFLTVPLGFIVKHMRDASFKGCIDQLYKCVKDLDEQHLKSNYHREILLSPKIYPGFCYEHRLLGIEDGPVASYYYAYWLDGRLRDILATDKTLIPSNAVTLPLKLKHDKSTQAYLKASTAFMVTDKLIIRPASPFFGFSIINELKVPFTDIKEETVEVGKKEALRLLVTTFLSDSALTDVFIRQLNQEKSIKRACLSNK
ncbi:uncharacterized protein LOC110746971 [Prunus avium]|uniref:Uncharacterized protein LOC110746971 n=1 Tax=Prunus avium TaxID=42229 RepID=A0A6P5RLT0_PRUAV|nr:uncharacterized protein LOC110746971 [Prunus avium]